MPFLQVINFFGVPIMANKVPHYWSPPGYEQPYPNYHTPTCNHPQDIFHPQHCKPKEDCECDEDITDTDTKNNQKFNYRLPVLEAFPWQETVLSLKPTIPPNNASVGDRYLLLNGWNNNNVNDIAWYDGTNWNYDTPLPGWVVYVEDEDTHYKFNGTKWVSFCSSTNKNYNIIYVSCNSDKKSIIKDGTYNNPYLTITDAINYIINNKINLPYVIVVLPGVYNENIYINNNNFITSINIVGISPNTVFIGNNTIKNSLAGIGNNLKALHSLYFSNLNFNDPIYIENLKNIEFNNVVFASNVNLKNCRNIKFTDTCKFNGYSTINILNGYNIYFFNECHIFSNIKLKTDLQLYNAIFPWNKKSTIYLNCNYNRDIDYSIVNNYPIEVYLHNCEFGLNDHTYTIPKNVTINAINSFINGNVSIDGLIILSNSFIKGNVNEGLGKLDIKNQRSSQIYMDLMVTDLPIFQYDPIFGFVKINSSYIKTI